MAFLKYVVINNFKSFKGEVTVGPLGPFTAVIGPNGCDIDIPIEGKSNFMDAISFALDIKTPNLRARRLEDLIHGSIFGRHVSRRASVSVIFELDDGSEKTFSRSIQNNSSEYRVDDQVVSHQVYIDGLMNLKINAQLKIFLVFQGMVEYISSQSPKERTALIEQLCGSINYKEDYERLQHKVSEKQENVTLMLSKKRAIQEELKFAKIQKTKAEEYDKVKRNLMEMKIELFLFQLYHCDKSRKQFENQRTQTLEQVNNDNEEKKGLESSIKEKERNIVKKRQDLSDMEKVVRNMEKTVQEKSLKVIENKESIAHLNKKAKSFQSLLNKANKENENKIKVVEELERELTELEEKRREYEETVLQDTQSQGITLAEEQIQEYYRLKSEVARRSAVYAQELDTLTRYNESKQALLDQEIRKKMEVNDRMKRMSSEKEKMEERLNTLMKNTEKSGLILDDKKKRLETLKLKAENYQGKAEQIETEYTSIIEQLQEMKFSNYQLENYKQKEYVVKKLKELHSGVIGRLYSFCEPIHKRFEIAITKIMGKNMNAIMVDTSETAISCIRYLKANRYERETFLPLNSLQVAEVKRRLSNLQVPRNVKLLYDVVNFPDEIKTALLFVFRNTVVCMNDDDAREVAYSKDKSIRNDAVTLDGTLYCKSGIISGGEVELSRRAKHWDVARVEELKQKKENLQRELSEIKSGARIRSEVAILETEVSGYEKRLYYMEQTRLALEKEIQDQANEMEKLKNEIENLEASEADIQDSMKNEDMIRLKKQLEIIEDEVFSEFCSNVGIKDIRQYEGREVRVHNEVMKKKLKFEDLKHRIEVQLEFEQSKDTAGNIQRWSNALQENMEKLEELKQEGKLTSDEYQKVLNKLSNRRTQVTSFKSDMEKLEKNLKKITEESKTQEKKVKAGEREIIIFDAKIKQQRERYKNILKQCTLEDVTLPLVRGRLSDVIEEKSSSTDTPSSRDSRETLSLEKRIVVDFKKLKRDYMKIDEDEEIENMKKEMLLKISESQTTLSHIKISDMKASEKIKELQESLNSTTKEIEKMVKRFNEINRTFNEIKENRQSTFMACIQKINDDIDETYKALTESQSGMAMLNVDDEVEPYLGGTHICCVVPGKSCQPMNSLSGGEKTQVALALSYSMLNYQSAPLVCFDEVDAALDNVNIKRVANCIKQKSENIQTIVISHKRELFTSADVLVGITAKEGHSESTVICVNLDDYMQPQ